MNYKGLFSLSIGILVNFLPLNHANALTVSFSRQYVEGVLEGIFSATDDNNDKIISPNEVTSFQASFTGNYGLLGEITAEEEKSINLFEYRIGQKNKLAFLVETTGREFRDPTFPIDINLELDVDFQRRGNPHHGCDNSDFDFFRDGDAILILCDPKQTGIAETFPEEGKALASNTSVPEPTSIIALLSLGGLAVVSRLR